MKIEIHLLQNVAPSCLNRDDTNAPKTCIFGGATRARVSSQSWKRAVRVLFRDEHSVPIGDRTKLLKNELRKLLLGDGEITPVYPIADLVSPESVPFVLDTFLQTYYAAMDPKKPDQTKVLIFVSDEEKKVAAQHIQRLLQDEKSELRTVSEKRRIIIEKLRAKGAQAVEEALEEAENPEEETPLSKGPKKLPTMKPVKEVLDALKNAHLTSDIALFGRMLAENSKTNVDAACQVAHALSTHKVSFENDFFTAVDDLTNETGAGMLGTQGFNSACFYRYALIDRDQLVVNLGGDTALADRTVKAFLRAFTLAIPSAKQNSHAAQNPPSFGLFIARESGVPVSLANAFASPVPTTKRYESESLDIVGDSMSRLVRYQGQMQKIYGLYEGATMAAFHDREDNKLLGNFKPDYEGSLTEAIDAIMARVSAGGAA